MGLFKTYNYESTVLADGITRFVCSLTGNDTTGNGTRANPYATMTKAIANGLADGFLVFKGTCVDNPTFGWHFSGVLADDEFANIIGGINLSDGTHATAGFIGFKADSAVARGETIRKCNVNTLTGTPLVASFIIGNFISNFNVTKYGDTTLKYTNNTILNFKNYLASTSKIIANSIISTSIDLYNFTSLTTLANIPLFQNCLFRKATVWKWNGNTIPTTNVTDIDSLIAALVDFGINNTTYLINSTHRAYFQAMFPAGGGTNILFSCRVVDDNISNGTLIFNRYDINGNPIDYALRLNSSNIALTMSDSMSYVGCYQASAKTDGASPVLEFDAPVNVDATGTETAGAPELLIYTDNGKFQIGVDASTQTRNRCTSNNVVKFERGITLAGFQSQMKSALGSRFSFGKFQKYNTTDAPCLPMESLEVVPYDTVDAVNPSATFPKFSAMFNGKCQMWYHTAGAKINQPVLFNDLVGTFGISITQEPSLTTGTNSFISEYGTWAITNADAVSFLLSSKSGCALRNIPLYFAKIELNLNYYN